MTIYLKTFLSLIISTIGVTILLFGTFHIIIYLIDSKPAFSGLRFLNWAFLIIGLPLTVLGFKWFLKTVTQKI